MADFSRPEYASYVQLCRELRLEREYREGDWVYWTKEPVELEVLVGWRPQEPGYVWLPSLGDLLEMLKAAGVKELSLHLGLCTVQDLRESQPLFGGSSLEEAAALLYRDVKGL